MQIQNNLVDKKLVASIRSEFKGPIIGVVGATSPDYYYSSDNGIITGYLIRKFLAGDPALGHLFTGGVEGVGLDAYIGASMFARENKVPSKFFALIPQFNMIPVYNEDDEFFNPGRRVPSHFNPVPYDIPSSYRNVSRLTGEKCKEVRAGEEMSDRRAYVAAIADVLVVVNGGGGTLDEAVSAIKVDTPIIVVQNTGGAAKDLADRKNNKFKPEKKPKYAKFTTPPHMLEDKSLNMDLVHIAFNEWDITETLEHVLRSKK